MRATGICSYLSARMKDHGQSIWAVVKIRVPFGVPIIVRHLIFRVPKKGP